MTLNYLRIENLTKKLAWTFVACVVAACTSSDEGLHIEEFQVDGQEEFAPASDSFDAEPSEVEDYSISDYQSFDPSGIHIPFEFDKASLTPQAIQALDKIIEGMTKDPLARLTIRGHADKQGREDYNENLSARRAKVIEDYLVKNGIDLERLRSIHLGVREPVVDEERVSAYRKNRRGDFHINYGPSAFGQ